MGPLLCQSDLFEHAICPLPWSWDMWSLLQQLLQFVLKNKQQENKANTFNRRWKCFISWSNWQHWYFRFVHITIHIGSAQFSSVQLLSRVRFFATPWTAAHQASLSVTNSWSLLKLISIESVIPSNHLIFCRPLFLLPSVFPSIRVFSSESALCIRWPKYWSFSFSISPSNEYSGLISFRVTWLDLLAIQGTLKNLL